VRGTGNPLLVAAGTTGTLLAGRYRVLQRLGSGGMASVFLAEDERLGRKVAVKRLHSESADDTARRFAREAKVGASLNHPNIVAVYDTVTDDDGVLLVMEYVEGGTLRDEIARGRLEPEAALKLLRGVASALDHVHEHGVVHRDVKPANILIGPDGRAKLADLGIASATERTQITRSGTVLGTAAYIAPERLDGGVCGPPADVYALAAVAYEALSGHKAVDGSTPMEIARRIVSHPPPDLARHWASAPPDAAAVLRQGMARDPDARPRSASSLVEDLARALEPESTRPTVPFAGRNGHGAIAPPRRGTARWLVPLLGLAALAVALVILLSSGGGGSGKPAAHAPPKRAAPSQTAATPPPALASDPAQTVSDFYTSSIGGNIDHAWSISTENLHREVGGRASLQRQEATLDSIHFTQLTTTSKTAQAATVSFADDARHQGFTDHCTGTASLVPGGSGGWLLDHIAVNCGRDAGPAPAGPPGKAKSKDKGHGKGAGDGGKGGD
jgi:eukaryotic-like serine/threonine-protein kinase